MLDLNCLEFILKEKMNQHLIAKDSISERLAIEIKFLEDIIEKHIHR
tara:strand:+ start:2078 stop:2218 length:141 start_codon:yes stop_codon:yes gene_type:complete